jgi:tRNA(Ile)-lysidine synthase TilS/MesJ
MTYAREHDIVFREDTSNTDIRYQRNSIRHEILPKFGQINPEYRENIRQFIEHTHDVLGFIDLSIEKWLQKYPVGTFLIPEFIEESLFFQKEIIRYLYTRAHSGTVGLSE